MKTQKTIKSIKDNLLNNDWTKEQADVLRDIIVEMERIKLLDEENRELRQKLGYEEPKNASLNNKHIIKISPGNEAYSERLVVNVTPTQKKFIERTAKKHGQTNSEFVRFMIDFFTDNFELK